uniref:Reverse transcriptase/retrotransposon-derived protein RNase H-like domain-containing protein n=1 Tax=Tanacetum cinerariifolium TaxID=118510 RepID=A0A699H7W8_TANCI|nr:hypothetical protein [Tanacetum cinerariifolium]
MLTALKEKEELVIYLAAAKEAVSTVLMTKRDGKQMPIYFVSRALKGLKINYTLMEKLILALMLSSLEVAGRLLKWRFKLEGHDIHYRPRTSVKGQILADFIVERPKDDLSYTPMKDKEELLDLWILFTNGSSCIDGSRASLIITNPKGMEFTYALRSRFRATNNEAEYEALIAGLRIAEQIGVKNLQANAKNLAITFKEFSIKQVPRGENKKAYALSKMASTSYAHLSKQMTPIYEYLTDEILREEKRKARAIRRKAALENNLDILEEKSEQAAIQEAKSKDVMEKYYNARVHNTSFKLGDLIYRSNKASHAEEGGKLGAKWEGPYEVTEALGKRAYKLRNRNGSILPQT